ncbi:MAG: TolC family protein, partial [candidate division WOR-3 bacterium]|nr:TolC family protein [candidate division WOR-3 bacterium]
MNIYLLILFLFSHPLSLDDCIKLALEHNPSLIKAQEEIRKREAEFSLGISEFLPQINTSMGYNRYSKRHLYYKEPEIHTTSFSLSQTIFDPSNYFTTLGKKKLKDASKESIVATRADVILSVGEAFFELAKGKKFLEITNLALKKSEEEYKKVETMVELGSASKLELLRREVDISEQRLELAKAEKDKAIAEVRLCKEMGIEPVNIEIIDEIIEPEPINLFLDILTEKALRERPEIKAKRLEIAYYRDIHKSAYTNYLPSISLTTNYGYERNRFPFETSLWNENDSWSIGINLTFPLFTGLGRHQTVRYAQSDIYIKEQELKEVRLNVILDVKEAYLSIINTQKELELTEKNLDAAEENHKYVTESY